MALPTPLPRWASAVRMDLISPWLPPSDFSAPLDGLFHAWLDGTAGSSAATLTITDDTAVEPTEQFTLTLAGYSLIQPGAITMLTVNIIDNDGPLFADSFE